MYISADTQLYCVIGNPIKHSLSPQLHNYMFKHYRLNSVYVAFEVKDIEKAMIGLKALGVKGANITVPFKEDVFSLVDDVDENAQFLGSINTVKNIDGKLVGYNTDFLGFMEMFGKYVKDYCDNSTVIVLGAGGASISTVYALFRLGIKRVFVLNRNPERAKKLSVRFKDKLEVVASELYNRDVLSKADIVINCTPVGLNRVDVPIDLSWVKRPLIVDIIYFDTPLVKKARAIGLTAINGLDMFIGQAYHSFRVWTGIEFDKKIAKKLIKGLIK